LAENPKTLFGTTGRRRKLDSPGSHGRVRSCIRMPGCGNYKRRGGRRCPAREGNADQSDRQPD
jgi:hypothetical protein